MTNFDKLFNEQKKDPEFVKAYHEAGIERLLNDFLDNLKERISKGEPKEVLLISINSMQRQIGLL
ncbi:hypothetical protein IIC38_14700 [candidate division KSB1 bacterium]|nr:hypothetical protein [candidate division KSB1 bacterium]